MFLKYTKKTLEKHHGISNIFQIITNALKKYWNFYHFLQADTLKTMDIDMAELDKALTAANPETWSYIWINRINMWIATDEG